MTDFADAYYRASRDFSGVAGALESAGFVNDVQVTIDAALEALKKEAERRANVGVNYVKGNIARGVACRNTKGFCRGERQ